MKKTLILLPILSIILFTPYVNAATPNFITGTKNVFDSFFNWLLLLTPAACAALITCHAFAKMLVGDDPLVVAKHNRAIKNILIGCGTSMPALLILKIITNLN